jgi:hypothetical protein
MNGLVRYEVQDGHRVLVQLITDPETGIEMTRVIAPADKREQPQVRITYQSPCLSCQGQCLKRNGENCHHLSS